MGVTPARLLDTRNGTGAPTGPVGSGRSIDLQVTGRGGVPSRGVSAVVLNVTVTQPTRSGYVTVWPTGAARPVASNLNFRANQTVPNSVIVKVGSSGKVSLFNSAGSSHLIADVSGYYSADSELKPTSPVRLLDTRDGTGGVRGPTSGTVDVQVAGRAGVPSKGVAAVVMNVTVTQPSGAGYLTVWPDGTPRPNASNLNYVAGQTVPNLVIAKLGSGGRISYYSSRSTHVIIDVLGFVSAPTMLTEEYQPVDRYGSWYSRAIEVQGVRRYNSIQESSVSSTPNWIEYNLGRQWGTLATTLSYDDERSEADSNTRFRILGDGVPLLDREVSFGESDDVTVDVTGVLRVRFEVTGVTRASYPTFADPRLIEASGAPFPAPQQYAPLTPARVLDTRNGTGAASGFLPGGRRLDLKVLGEGGVPGAGVGAVVLNVTVTQPARGGYITVWPKGVTRPLASNLNFVKGQTRPNLVVVPVGDAGMVSLYNGSAGRAHLIADVLGWYPGTRSAEPATVFLTENGEPVDRYGSWYSRAVEVQGVRRYNSIQESSVSSTPNWIEYNLGRQWGTLATTLSYDDERSEADSNTRFRILGDGVPLLDREVRFGEAIPVDLSVSGVLRVRFEVTGVTRANYPTFADPTLSR